MSNPMYVEIPNYGPQEVIPGFTIGGRFFRYEDGVEISPESEIIVHDEGEEAALTESSSIVNISHDPFVPSGSTDIVPVTSPSKYPNDGKHWTQPDLFLVMFAVSAGASYVQAGEMVGRSGWGVCGAIANYFGKGNDDFSEMTAQRLRKAFKLVPEAVIYDHDRPLMEGMEKES